MAEAVFRLLFIEKFKQLFVSFKSVLFDENYARRTIIGRNYKCDNLRGSKTSEDPRPLPKIQKIHGDDEEAARCWSKNKLVVSYGPLYRGYDEEAARCNRDNVISWKNAKDEAWKHVLRNSNDEGGENETIGRYMEAVRRVEEESRALYGDIRAMEKSSMPSLSRDEQFIWIMILDGCFLLQVALLVLGGAKQLGYPVDDPIFGEESGNKTFIRAAVSSMFDVGNQIPILVLKELMKQSFFQNVFNQGKWKQPLDLERWVLFELLLVPILEMREGAKFIPTSMMGIYGFSAKRPFGGGYIMKSVISYFVQRNPLQFWFRRKAPSQKAHDLLHGLWLLITGGLANSTEFDAKNWLVEEEEEEENEGAYYSSDVLPTVPSATELKEAGIVIKCSSRGAMISGISFQKIMFSPVLLLPRIIIDHEIESIEKLFYNLIKYEVTQELGESRRKICSYLQLMHELVRTPEDAKLLARSGVIVVDPDQEENLPKLFQLWPNDIPRVKTKTSLCRVRDQLINYTRPSMLKKFGDILSLVVLLTIIQTLYTVLSFYLRK